jgi:hypothetical protein
MPRRVAGIRLPTRQDRAGLKAHRFPQLGLTALLLGASAVAAAAVPQSSPAAPITCVTDAASPRMKGTFTQTYRLNVRFMRQVLGGTPTRPGSDMVRKASFSRIAR